MKMTKSLFLAFAGLGLFACSNEEVTTENGNGETASVVIKLNGIESGSRTEGTPTTGQDGEGETINLTNGKILFTNGITILKVADLDLIEAKGNGQLVHEVPAGVSQVQIVGNTTGKTGLLAVIGDNKPLSGVTSAVIAATNEQNMDDLPLYGEDTSLDVASGVIDSEEGHTNIYQADVELGTQFSRIEIGNFKCEDLGNLYSKVDIKVVGLLNFNNSVTLSGTASEPVMIYDSKTESGTVWEPETPNTEGDKVVFGEANEKYGWAWDKSSISMTQANTVYNPGESQDKRYVYNFIPEGDVLATLYVNASPKNSSALQVNNTLKGKLGTLAPGHIYRVDYTFNETDIKPWDPNTTMCVNVNVTVKKWQIKTLTPTFE